MITFGTIKLKASTQLEEEYLKEIDSTCDSLKIISEEIANYGLMEHRVKATKNGYSIYFSLHVSLSNKSILGVSFINSPSIAWIEYELENVVQGIKAFQNKEVQKKLDIINCIDDKCPLCGSKTEKTRLIFSGHKKHCENRCYVVNVSKNNRLPREVSVFEESNILTEFITIRNNYTSFKDFTTSLNEIIDKIAYLKENDRYLARILKGD
ncbi:gp462 [Bacillus phage G]|uniref:Gp462 n=1 Tax=Bacillus phage G TaxID=2884420 RepID=G3MAK3_9CAUD|nr:gp462 [Bacillus phage G]AEO93720.1 gp462 [Bacillus phage G]